MTIDEDFMQVKLWKILSREGYSKSYCTFADEKWTAYRFSEPTATPIIAS